MELILARMYMSIDQILIDNRLEKLIVYLNNEFPDEGWNVHLSNVQAIEWFNILVSGHSQGGGHAAYIAKSQAVKRVLLFASPNDYSDFFVASASWVSETSETPDSNYYAFGNLYDEVVDFSKQFQIWENLQIPNPSDSTNVDFVISINQNFCTPKVI